MEGLLDITDKEFRQIADLVYHRFGIHLSDKKKVLVRGRLNKLLKAEKYTSFSDYYEDILTDKTGRNLLTLVDKISNQSHFLFPGSRPFRFSQGKGPARSHRQRCCSQFQRSPGYGAPVVRPARRPIQSPCSCPSISRRRSSPAPR